MNFSKLKRFGIAIVFWAFSLLLLYGAIWLLRHLPIWALFPLIFFWGLITLVGIYFLLARDDIRAGFVFVPEGYAIVITRLKSFHRVVLNCKDYEIDQKNLEVKKTSSKKHRRLPGGLVFFLFPIEDVKLFHEDEKKKSALIPLKEQLIRFNFQGKDIGGNIVKIDGCLITRIKNPYKLLFTHLDTPWKPFILSLIESVIKEEISKRTFKDVIEMEEIERKCQERVQRISRIYGVEVDVKLVGIYPK